MGRPHLDRVKDITPSGLIKVGEKLYRNDNGQERGGSTYGSGCLVEPTAESREEVERIELIAKVQGFNPDKASLAKLRAIVAALASPDPAEGGEK